MIKRLLLTAAMSLALGTGLALGTAAFAQTAADPAKTDINKTDINQPATAAQPPSITLSAGVSVTEPDRARIGESIARMSVKPLRGVDFSVSVGARVPRELRVYRLPADVVQIVPPYRDYRFLVVDKDIVIVEPSANKIVTILPRDPAITTATATTAAPATSPTTAAPTTAAPTAAVPPTSASTSPTTSTTATTSAITTSAIAATSTATAPAPSTSSTPTPDQPSTPSSQTAAEPDRAKVKKHATTRSQSRTSRAGRDDARWARGEVRVGQRVPDHVELYDLPPRLSREVPSMRESRYRGYVTGSRARTIYQEFD